MEHQALKQVNYNFFKFLYVCERTTFIVYHHNVYNDTLWINPIVIQNMYWQKNI